jgi:hypothetical protein
LGAPIRPRLSAPSSAGAQRQFILNDWAKRVVAHRRANKCEAVHRCCQAVKRAKDNIETKPENMEG